MAAERKRHRPCQNTVFGHRAGQNKDTGDSTEQDHVFDPAGRSARDLTNRYWYQKEQDGKRHPDIHNLCRNNKNSQNIKNPRNYADKGTYGKAFCRILIGFRFVFKDCLPLQFVICLRTGCFLLPFQFASLHLILLLIY